MGVRWPFENKPFTSNKLTLDFRVANHNVGNPHSKIDLIYAVLLKTIDTSNNFPLVCVAVF